MNGKNEFAETREQGQRVATGSVLCVLKRFTQGLQGASYDREFRREDIMVARVFLVLATAVSFAASLAGR